MTGVILVFLMSSVEGSLVFTVCSPGLCFKEWRLTVGEKVFPEVPWPLSVKISGY